MNAASNTEPKYIRIGDSLVQNTDCDDYFVKDNSKCQGGWVLKQPNGECRDGYIPVDDRCWERWMFKLCNGEFTLSETSCLRDFLGCTCKDCKITLYTNQECAPLKFAGQCNGVYVKKGDFCLGQCLDGYVNVNGNCREQSTTRLCNGKPILKWDFCDGECGDGYFNIDGKCLDKMLTILCNGVYILQRGPTCDGKCSTGLVPVDGTCQYKFHFQLCNGVYISKSDICVGDCAEGYIKIDGLCASESNTRLCNGVSILNSAICDGKCPQTYRKSGNECVFDINFVTAGRPPWDSSATSSISAIQLSQQLFYSPNQCPQLHCKNGPNCCLLAFDVQKKKLVCPPQC